MKKDYKVKLIVLIFLVSFLVIFYIGFVLYSISSFKKYENKVLPNTFLEEFDISYYSYPNVESKMDFYQEYLLSKKIKLTAHLDSYTYSYGDLGISIDKEKTIQEIQDYKKNLGFREKLKIMNGKHRKKFSFVYKIDVDKLRSTLNTLKEILDISPINGYFDTSEGVHYQNKVDGYSLNIEDSIQEFQTILVDGLSENTNILLVGDTVNAYGNDNYETIDTMTSSFVTNFMPNTYLRNINLNTALNYINGSVVEPGEIFSYCDKAGPFNKQGYVFYYEFVGNGVCQIATTTYNAALLGGLEIVKRYPHAKKSLYVEGGLDATVASYSSGWCVDMQFRNTYQYPIYIKAYSEGGRAHVEFWSNHDAKEGYEYTTESMKIGVRGYRSYLHVFKDGVEVEKRDIATTWYTEE